METRQRRPKAEEAKIYEQIKNRLEELGPKSTPELVYSPINDVPGPGYYSINLETNRSKKISFPSAPRFNYTPSINRNPMESSDSTLIMKGMNSDSIRDDAVTGEINNFDSIASQRSLKLLFITQEKQNSKANSTPLRGSFPKAPRRLDLSVESPSQGPGTYYAVLSPASAAFSFGRKLNSVNSSIAYPGPGTYRPEACKFESRYTGNRSATILKGEKIPLDEIDKDAPQGPNYYLHSNFTSFDPSKAKGPSLGYGNKLDFVLKSQKDFPGPGAYMIPNPSNLNSSRKKLNSEFPSLGRPNDIRRFHELLPGPGEYDPASVLTSPVAKIGTSKRPGHFDPKKEAEIVFSEEKTKRLKRLEKRLAELAKLAEMKSHAKRVRPQIKKRILLFEELAKSSSSPGFIYNINQYQIGKNSVGGKFGKDHKDSLAKQLKEKMNLPGPLAYDVSKAEAKKPSAVESTFGTAKRAENFVKKDSENIPGVGNYTHIDEKTKKGGVFTKAKKGLNDSRTEEMWEQAHQPKHKPDDLFQFMQDIDAQLEALFKKPANNYENELIPTPKQTSN